MEVDDWEIPKRANSKRFHHSISGKEYIKAVYCQPAYLTSMQSI